ncbi:MAG: Holliday junction branch migration protein RuvA [Clostridia bacterium]|nr:Holliday junction branch migration protein RuvA [Clostridia bacterium]
MFAYLEGKIDSKGQNEVILDVQGVGFELNCSMNTLTELPPIGEQTRLYTVLNVKEDLMELYGFASTEEKRMFERLTSISGIGPKSAIQILSSMSLRDLTLAIMTGDTTALARAQGIGKKTAQRIALELKEKVSEADLSGIQMSDIAATAQVPVSDALNEAIQGLISLGYTAQEAARAVKQVSGQSDEPAQLIMLALRGMSSGR